MIQQPAIRHRFDPLRGLVLLACLAATACGEDVRGTTIAPRGGGPVYLTAALVSAGDLDETHLILTSTFDETTTIDPTSGVSVVGPVVPVVHNGAVFLTEGNAPVISRYDLDATGNLVRTAELSFAGVGVAAVPSWNVYIVSDTKGYVFDAAGARLVAWDPSRMELTGAVIGLSTMNRQGWLPNLVLEQAGPRRRGNHLLIPLSWVDQDFNYRHATGLVVVDLERDEVVLVDEDERCGEPYASVEAPSGDLYFFPSAESSAHHFFAEGMRPTCLIRVPDGALQLDDGEPMNLSALGSGSAASGVVPDGATGFFFSMADAALSEAHQDDGEPYWRVWHYDFATAISRPVESLPVWAGTTYYVDVGGTRYLPHWTETDRGPVTTLYRLDGGADPAPVFSFNASWYGFGQLR